MAMTLSVVSRRRASAQGGRPAWAAGSPGFAFAANGQSPKKDRPCCGDAVLLAASRSIVLKSTTFGRSVAEAGGLEYRSESMAVEGGALGVCAAVERERVLGVCAAVERGACAVDAGPAREEAHRQQRRKHQRAHNNKQQQPEGSLQYPPEGSWQQAHRHHVSGEGSHVNNRLRCPRILLSIHATPGPFRARTRAAAVPRWCPVVHPAPAPDSGPDTDRTTGVQHERSVSRRRHTNLAAGLTSWRRHGGGLHVPLLAGWRSAGTGV